MKTVIQHLDSVCEEHGVSYSSPSVREKYFTFEMDGLPVLPFFLDLAIELMIPLASISVDHSKGHEGCDTCGYGGECEFRVSVQL